MTSPSVAQYLLQTCAVLALIRWLYVRVTGHSISRIPGPAKSDWFFGNLTDLYINEAGISQISWQKQFGLTFKAHGFLGEEYLMSSDPKALQHIYSNPDTYVRRRHRGLQNFLFGPGLLVVDGEDHRRHRRVMQPAFGTGHLKALFPVLMRRHSQKLLSVIKKEIESKRESGSATINIHNYVARVTLDIICDAAFDYEIGALDQKVDALKEAFHIVEANSGGSISKGSLLSQLGFEHFPLWMLEFLSHSPIKAFSQARTVHDTFATTSERLVQQKMDTFMRGLDGEKDLLSILVRANAVEEQKWKLTDSEVNAEIATIMIGGYATTSSTLSFSLWELAKNPAMQARIREEIFDIKRQAIENGETEIGMNWHENMPLLVAFINEVLRYHPVSFLNDRVVTQDSVIPLSHPVTLTSGQVVNEIPVTKGQKILTNIAGYNRLPELFGADSHEFNIDRWLEDKPDGLKRSYGRTGIYANLMTFGHGPHACIGWRFSLYEIQCLLIDLLSAFEFGLVNDGKPIIRIPTLLMHPGIQGERAAGSMLPLNISVLRD